MDFADKNGTSEVKKSFFEILKSIIIGKPKNPEDRSIFHKLSLIAFFAWVGLGADLFSSSCYGPEQSFRIVMQYPYLSLFIGIGIVITIFIISTSYSQIVELFPSGGGGYLVASKLLSPTMGVISGCALLVDYVLTISVSVASGADAIFSFFPLQFLQFKIYFSFFLILLLIVLNLRGIKESVSILMPIFAVFVITHIFLILYACFFHLTNFLGIVQSTGADIRKAGINLGTFGLLALLLKAYSMGAGTYTGIEAVSNGIPYLREPRVQTAKKTMVYMAMSLSFMALGLMIVYLLYNIKSVPGKTLNALAFESAMAGWPDLLKNIILFVTLFSEATLLFVAAQGGFMDGPRVLSNMAIDKWMPSRFTFLSDRLVTQFGILVMGGAALITLIITKGSVDILLILYSINVFITFNLSQLGMVRHWWISRKTEKEWFKKLMINSVGLVLCLITLTSFIVIKFGEGGWVTLFITSFLVFFCIWVKSLYNKVRKDLNRLDSLLMAVENSEKLSQFSPENEPENKKNFNFKDKTAVLFVSGYNGIGLHSLFGIQKFLGFDTFKNYVFVQIGIVDAANFKGVEEMDQLKKNLHKSTSIYEYLMRKYGYYTETFTAIGTDVVNEMLVLIPEISNKFPNAVYFGGQLVFPKQGFFKKFMTNLLHNNIVFTIQEELYYKGIPFVLLPIRV